MTSHVKYPHAQLLKLIKIINFHGKYLKKDGIEGQIDPTGMFNRLFVTFFERNNCVYVAKINDQNIQDLDVGKKFRT